MVKVSFGSAAPVRLLELQTYDLHLMPTSAARRWATALENELLQTAVELWRLHFATGHWRGDLLAARM